MPVHPTTRHRPRAAGFLAALLLPVALAVPRPAGAADAALSSPDTVPAHLHAAAPAARVGAAAPSSPDTARALHLLDRATYGVRPEELAELLDVGPERWLDRQLHPERIDDSALAKRLARYPAADMSVAELLEAYPPPGVLRAGAASPDSLTPAMRRERAQRSPQRILGELVGARLERAVHSERQLEEVMTDFWFNHFNVFFGKNQLRWLVADYERSAIRPHVFGRFEELLVATARHPAMLVYLDNWRSAAPEAPGRCARPLRPRAGRPRGLNENYARELLELHTLGVDGGYTQQDVVEVARAFTGWTIARGGRARGREGAIAFVFRPELHDGGEKVVLGRRLPAGRGEEDALEVLRALARHPATARRIATRLAERFVADDPPPALVERLGRVFLDTGGDLREVTRALFTAPEFYDPAYRAAKVKRPFELVASALRVSGVEAVPSRALLATLRSFGHVPYLESAPTGYPATREEWVNSGAMLGRMNFGLALAAGRPRRASPRAPELARQAARAGSRAELVERLARAVLPGRDTRELQQIIVADLTRQESSHPEELAARALGLLLGSPEFQKY